MNAVLGIRRTSTLADYQTLGGWLALVTLGVLVSTLSSLLMVFLLVGGSFADPRTPDLWLIPCYAVLAGLGSRCFSSLMKRKRDAREKVLWLSALLLLISLVPTKSGLNSSLVAPLVWIPYMLLSVRVQRTLVR